MKEFEGNLEGGPRKRLERREFDLGPERESQQEGTCIVVNRGKQKGPELYPECGCCKGPVKANQQGNPIKMNEENLGIRIRETCHTYHEGAFASRIRVTDFAE